MDKAWGCSSVWENNMLEVLARYCGDGNFGYLRVRLSDGRIIAEHRFLVEQNIGRKLKSDEVVHHKNGSRSDNRLCNLKLTTNSKHVAAHHRKKDIKIKMRCHKCGRFFTTVPSRIRWKEARGQQDFFCSRNCSAKGQKRGPRGAVCVRVRMTCPVCGVSFTRIPSQVRRRKKIGQKHFYCSTSCRIKGSRPAPIYL